MNEISEKAYKELTKNLLKQMVCNNRGLSNVQKEGLINRIDWAADMADLFEEMNKMCSR